MITLLAAQYENPKFICNESIYLTDISEPIFIPDNLTVRGDLNLSRSNILSLPNNLKINSMLNIMGTPITFIDNIFADVLMYERDVIFGKNVKIRARSIPTIYANRTLINNKFK